MRIFSRLAVTLALLSLAQLLSATSLAAGPPIPDNAASGRVSATTVSTVDIDNRRLRLAPGARIYSLSNTTVTPNMVVPGSTVRYVFDERGQVRTIWIVDDGGGARRAIPRQPGQRP